MRGPALLREKAKVDKESVAAARAGEDELARPAGCPVAAARRHLVYLGTAKRPNHSVWSAWL